MACLLDSKLFFKWICADSLRKLDKNILDVSINEKYEKYFDDLI